MRVIGPGAEHRDHACVWIDDRVARREDLLRDRLVVLLDVMHVAFVMLMVEWPSHACSRHGFTPKRAACVANVWRSECKHRPAARPRPSPSQRRARSGDVTDETKTSMSRFRLSESPVSTE
jgi:hypothetical protein